MGTANVSSGVSRRSFIAASVLATAGCVTASDPPLARLYANVAGNPDQPPLILIPGAFGSRLTRRSTGEEIWPRSNASLLFSSYPDIGVRFDRNTLDPLSDEVVATDIFRKGLGQDFYGAVLDTLEQIGGYRRMFPGQQPRTGKRAFYVYLYDWRLDTVAAVQGLHDLIEQIAEDWGDASLKVDILGHSNGGLLARYYARYGVADMLVHDPVQPRWHGADRIRRLLMVGTPNLGSMQPVLSHVRGEEIGLRHIPADVVATCPGAPQLMPHPNVPCFVDTRGNALEYDVYDVETWRELGWSIFQSKTRVRAQRRNGGRKKGLIYLQALEAYLDKQLRRGRRFHESLSIPPRPDEPVPYVFGGDCTPTLARLVVEHGSRRNWAHERPETINRPLAGINYDALIAEPGDGVVCRSSLLARHPGLRQSQTQRLALKQTVFLCEAHQLLTGNASFQDNLLYNLLKVESV